MPSGLRKTTGNHFEIYYEQPWGGVASDKDAVDIAENQLVTQQNVVAVDGALCQVALINAALTNPAWSADATNSYPVLIFELGGDAYAVDQFGQMYIMRAGNAGYLQWFPFTSGLPSHIKCKAPDYPWTNPPTAVRVVNGIAYIANFGNQSIYTFNGFYNGFALGQYYVGGLIMGVLDDYLLQMNTNQTSGGGLQPNGVSWSGPGKFTTWNPALDRTSGYNQLAALEDQITGFLSLASVGIIISQKGLTEMSPTGIGIGPFNFTTLWISDVGQGGTYPATIVQYGQVGYLLTDSGAYSVSTNGGFQDIAGSAKKAILESYQSPNSSYVHNVPISLPGIAGTILLYFWNSSYTTPFYMLVGVPGTSTATQPTPPLILWFYDLKTNIWQQAKFNIDTLCAAQNDGGPFTDGRVISVSTTSLYNGIPVQTIFAQPLTIIWVVVQYGATYYTIIVYPSLYNKYTADFATNVAGNLNLTFRAEEMKLGHTRKPTIRRAVVKAYGTGVLTLTITDVSGNTTSLGTITLDGTTNARTYYSPFGVSTVEAPQLSITSTNFKGTIIKAMLAGTFADGEID